MASPTPDSLAILRLSLAAGQLSEELAAVAPELIAEVEHARKALTTVLNTVGDPDDWDNPSSALERIGDAADSERYPVWKRYNSEA